MENENNTKTKSRADIAEELFLGGANCSQSVIGAFSDLISLDFDTLMKISSSFGGGVARMREICGAVSAGAMVLGFLKGFGESPTYEEKKDHYMRVTQFADKFALENKSYVCSELLGVKRESPVPTPRSEEFYHSRPCIKYIRSAVSILEKELGL